MKAILIISLQRVARQVVPCADLGQPGLRRLTESSTEVCNFMCNLSCNFMCNFLSVICSLLGGGFRGLRVRGLQGAEGEGDSKGEGW